MIIILLSGYSQSGKNTVGDYLEGKYGFFQCSFADVLKRHVASTYEFPYTWTLTQEGKQMFVQGTNKTVRELLIEQGQEIRRRTNNPGFFADLVAKQIQDVSYKYSKFVITDWRLPVELETVQKRFSDFPKTRILKVQVKKHGQQESPVKHWTETSLENETMDAILINPGDTHQNLYDAIERMCANLYIH